MHLIRNLALGVTKLTRGLIENYPNISLDAADELKFDNVFSPTRPSISASEFGLYHPMGGLITHEEL